MESYHRGKKFLEEKYGKLIIVKPYNDDNGIVDKQQKYIKQIIDISDEEGLRLAYETKGGISTIINYLSQERRIFPADHIDD